MSENIIYVRNCGTNIVFLSLFESHYDSLFEDLHFIIYSGQKILDTSDNIKQEQVQPDKPYL